MKMSTIIYIFKWLALRLLYVKREFIQLLDKLIYQKQSLSLLHYHNGHRSPFKSMLFYNTLGRILWGTKEFISLLTHNKLGKKSLHIEGFDEPNSAPQTLHEKGSHTALFPKSPMINTEPQEISSEFFQKIEHSFFLAYEYELEGFDRTKEWDRVTEKFHKTFFTEDKKLIQDALINFRASPTLYKELFNDQFRYIDKDEGYLKSYLKSLDLVLEYHRNASVINKELLASSAESLAGNNLCVNYQGKRLSEKVLFHTLITDDVLKHVPFNHQEQNFILDIGAGYGGLARILKYYIPHSTYILIDLPESLMLSAYFLKYNFPDKKIALLDDIINELNHFNDIMKKYDFIIIPPSILKSIKTESIDLVINTASLGFMAEEYLTFYLEQTYRVLKQERYFYSLNKVETDHWGIGMYEWNLKNNYITISHEYNNRFSFPQWIGKKI
jgi:putative sugar O-methyltransferase